MNFSGAGILFLYALVNLSSVTVVAAESQAFQPKENVLVLIAKDKNSPAVPYSAEVNQVNADSTATISYTQFYEGYFSREFLKAVPFIALVKETSQLAGIHKNDIVCLNQNTRAGAKDQDVKILHLFENGMAEVQFGDFFGKRVLIFKRSAILDINQLEFCKE